MLFNRNEADAFADKAGVAELEIDHFADVRAIDSPAPGLITVAIIDRRALGREALTQALTSADGRFRGRAFADIGEWELSSDRTDTSLILLECGAVGNDRSSP
jgi:hypothetical protein